jgi:hypothetical protein
VVGGYGVVDMGLVMSPEGGRKGDKKLEDARVERARS